MTKIVYKLCDGNRTLQTNGRCGSQARRWWATPSEANLQSSGQEAHYDTRERALKEQAIHGGSIQETTVEYMNIW